MHMTFCLFVWFLFSKKKKLKQTRKIIKPSQFDGKINVNRENFNYLDTYIQKKERDYCIIFDRSN